MRPESERVREAIATAAVPACVRDTRGTDHYFDLGERLSVLEDHEIAAILTGEPAAVDTLAARVSGISIAETMWVDEAALVSAIADVRPWLVGLER